jgi:hypothetical protein
MLKRIVGRDHTRVSKPDEHWLNLDGLAQVEVSSEEMNHPIESALLLFPKSEAGWEAAESGQQIVRILFERPPRIDRIVLEFQESKLARTQEFVLRWSSNGGTSYREIVRQQYNFTPPGTTAECENYRVDLSDVTHLELEIIPDITGGPARASLARVRLVGG